MRVHAVSTQCRPAHHSWASSLCLCSHPSPQHHPHQRRQFNGSLTWELHPEAPRALVTRRMHVGSLAGPPRSAALLPSTLISPAPSSHRMCQRQTLHLCLLLLGLLGKPSPLHTCRTSQVCHLWLQACVSMTCLRADCPPPAPSKSMGSRACFFLHPVSPLSGHRRLRHTC